MIAVAITMPVTVAMVMMMVAVSYQRADQESGQELAFWSLLAVNSRLFGHHRDDSLNDGLWLGFDRHHHRHVLSRANGHHDGYQQTHLSLDKREHFNNYI